MTPSLSRRVAFAVFAAFALLFAIQAEGLPPSWNEASRLATVESLVERGTWRIDESTFVGTGDKMMFGGHYFSDKTPLFQALAALPYALIHHALGLGLALDACDHGWRCGRRWLTVAMVGLPAAAMLAVFFQSLAAQVPAVVALAATAVFGFGTMVWPFALTFMPHVPSAACLLVSFVLLRGRSVAGESDKARSAGRAGARALFGAGLLAGLAVALDLPALFLSAALATLALLRHRRAFPAFVVGALVPATATALLDRHISGSVWPPFMVAEGWQYPGSRFPVANVGWASLESVPTYALQGLIGDRGLFSYSPILLLGVAGLVVVIGSRSHPMRTDAVAVAVGALAFAAFLFAREGLAHGGKAYGNRYFLPLIPLLAWFGAFAVPTALRSLASRLAAVILAVAVVLSVVSAYQGTLNPWATPYPVVYLGYAGTEPYPTVCSNLTRQPCFRWRRWWRRLARPPGGAARGRAPTPKNQGMGTRPT